MYPHRNVQLLYLASHVTHVFFWVLNMRSSVVACVLPQLHRVYVLRESFAFHHAGVERAIVGGCVCLATAAPRMYVR